MDERRDRGAGRTGLLIGVVGLLALAAGCASQNQDLQTRKLPDPVFIDARPAPARPVSYVPPPAPVRATPQPAGEAHKEWVPNYRSRRWQGIVIHHSAIPDKGNAATLDRAHKGRGFDGLGYHFVIGNGTGSKDGEVEVGFRWPIQREGAHAKMDRLERVPDSMRNWWNEHTIGIVLIGNFEKGRPSQAQLRALVTLVVWLCREFDIPPDRVYFHREVKMTECPGSLFPRAEVRARIREALAK